jgi:hypothetical protein
MLTWFYPSSMDINIISGCSKGVDLYSKPLKHALGTVLYYHGGTEMPYSSSLYGSPGFSKFWAAYYTQE